MNQTTKCINNTYIHRFEATFDENMNVTEKCILCNIEYFHNVGEKFNDYIK